jgi:hypothetical protein
MIAADEGVLCNEEMMRLWIPKYRATTKLGAERVAYKALREWLGHSDVEEYKLDGPAEIGIIHARNMEELDHSEDESYDPDFNWHSCEAADEGATEFWEVSWE